MKITNIVALSLLSVSLVGCGPVKVLDPVNIGPNETAWAIPLDGLSQAGQVKFNSVEFLNAKKISVKRYMIDKVQRQTGRFYFDYEWIPATRIIRVDRSLVTQEWKGQGADIGVVTADSVQLRVGLTVTASIDEDDASTYLYYHGERPLSDVLNQNVRSFAVAELTRKYSEKTLEQAQKEGTQIYQDLFKDTASAFKQKGITIQYLGNAEGLTYADPTVQASINRSYTAQQDQKTAEMEQKATKVRNETIIMTAQAQADAARKTAEVKDASELQTELKIRLLLAQAQATMAEKWNGVLPANILPSNSPMLMSLGAPSSASK